MTIFNAQPVDFARERRMRNIKIYSVVAILVIAFLGFWFRHWPQEHVVDKFFTAVEKKDYNTAYGIWFHDPDWQKHPEKYPRYTEGQFELDWGPSGEYGPITSHEIKGSVRPRSKGTVSGIVVAVIVNHRAEPACLWVEDSPHTIDFSPISCQ